MTMPPRSCALPIVYFIMVAAVVLAGNSLSVLAQCPVCSLSRPAMIPPAVVCEGAPNPVTVNLNEMSLTMLPASWFNDAACSSITSIILTNNLLQSLTANIFDTMPALSNLMLNINFLTSLPAGIFDNLPQLSSVSLESNSLTELRSGIFDNNVDLAAVHLSQNNLRDLPAGLFDPLPALTEVWLFQNQLTRLRTGVFDSMPLVTSLRMHVNQFSEQSVPWNVFQNVNQLTILSLHTNRFTALHRDFFSYTPLLHVIGLDNNQITYFPPGLFRNQGALDYLYLNNNLLTALPNGTFDGLTTLVYADFRGNPWNCGTPADGVTVPSVAVFVACGAGNRSIMLDTNTYSTPFNGVTRSVFSTAFVSLVAVTVAVAVVDAR